MEQFKYQIGDKVYIQKPLVMGQTEQLLEELKGITFPTEFNVWSIKEILGEKLYICLAISLLEEGKSPKRTKEDLQIFADDLRWAIDIDTTIKVIQDFFTCNLVASQRLNEVMLKIIGSISKTASKNLSASFPEEMLPNGITSSGDILSESVILTSSSDRER